MSWLSALTGKDNSSASAAAAASSSTPPPAPPPPTIATDTTHNVDDDDYDDDQQYQDDDHQEQQQEVQIPIKAMKTRKNNKSSAPPPRDRWVKSELLCPRSVCIIMMYAGDTIHNAVRLANLNSFFRDVSENFAGKMWQRIALNFHKATGRLVPEAITDFGTFGLWMKQNLEQNSLPFLLDLAEHAEDELSRSTDKKIQSFRRAELEKTQHDAVVALIESGAKTLEHEWQWHVLANKFSQTTPPSSSFSTLLFRIENLATNALENDPATSSWCWIILAKVMSHWYFQNRQWNKPKKSVSLYDKQTGKPTFYTALKCFNEAIRVASSPEALKEAKKLLSEHREE